MILNHSSTFNKSMGILGDTLRRVLVSGDEKQWSLMIQRDNKVVEPYLSALKNLCNTPEFQAIQEDAMGYYRDNAVAMCQRFKLYTDRAFCLMFDISVNNGSVKASIQDNLGYTDKMKAISEAAAQQKGKWYADSLSRKTCIINGGGIVHQDSYSFNFTEGSAFDDVMLVKEVLDMLNDEAKVSEWAKEAVDFLVANGILKGDNNGNFNPQDPISREAVAVVVYNTIKFFNKGII